MADIESEDTLNLSTNAVPQTILAEFVMLGNLHKLHDPAVGFGPRGTDESVGGCPVYEFGTASAEARETTIVLVGFVLGHIVA